MNRSRVGFGSLTLSFFSALSGCTSFDAASRAQFAQGTSCPAEKVVVTEQPGQPLPPANPPPDIAADPGKLAVWKADDRARREDAAATVYVAKGCGQERHYLCGRSERHLASTVCSEYTADPNGIATPPTEADVKKCAGAPTKPLEPAAKRAPDAKHCTLGELGDCTSACNASDAESCAILGKMYGEGIGVDTDLAKSNDLLALACGAGSARGCHSLGVVHDFGHGVPADPKVAIPFYDQACSWGYADACANLAGHYASGTGIKADSSRAVTFAKMACAWGSTAGCKRLGAFDLGGIGVDKDAGCAEIAFRKACAGGDPSACDLARQQKAAADASTAR